MRKAVRIEAGHRCHTQEVAGFAVHHYDRAAFQADAPCGIILQGPIDGKPNRVALDILASFQFPYDPARCSHLDPPGAGYTAKFLFVLLFQSVLADLVARCDEQRIPILFGVFFGIRRPDVANKMAYAGPCRIEARETALRNDTGQIGQPHADRGEFVIGYAGSNLDRLISRTIGYLLANIRGLIFIEVQDLRKGSDRRFRVGSAIGNDIDAKIRSIGGEGGAITVQNPAAPGRDERKVDPIAFRFQFVFFVLGNRDVSHPRCQQHAKTAHGGADDEGPPVERIVQRRLRYDLFRLCTLA